MNGLCLITDYEKGGKENIKHCTNMLNVSCLTTYYLKKHGKENIKHCTNMLNVPCSTTYY